MKLYFKLIELSRTRAAGGNNSAEQAVTDVAALPPYDPAGHQSRLARLKDSLAALNVPAVSLADISVLSVEERENTVVFICGSAAGGDLYATVQALLELDTQPILIVDALADYPGITVTLQRLTEERLQFAIVAQAAQLVKTKRLMIYQYAKPDSTMTLMVVVDAGRPDASVLTIERERAPFKDEESFTGGFLDAYLENLAQCVAREAREETNTAVPLDQIILVDVRSSPLRDERGHIIDHGYMWLVPDALRERVLASAEAGDDAKAGSARFVPVKDLLARKHMAFDHYDLLLRAVATGKILPAANPFLRLLHRVIAALNSLADNLAANDAVLGQAFRHKSD